MRSVILTLSLWNMPGVSGTVVLDVHGLDDERVAFPLADGIAVERRLHVRMRAAVGVDASPLHPRLVMNGHAARREEELDRILADAHDVRHAGRRAVVADLLAGAVLRIGIRLPLLIVGEILALQRRHLALGAGRAELERPDAAPVRQLVERRVVTFRIGSAFVLARSIARRVDETAETQRAMRRMPLIAARNSISSTPPRLLLVPGIARFAAFQSSSHSAGENR